MAIRTQNGRVLLKNRRVSCECCEENSINIGVNFGEIGEDCDCEVAPCFTVTNPSPAQITVDGIEYKNTTPGSEKITLAGVLVQFPVFVNDAFLGFNNIVSSPTLIGITGTVGGDIAVTVRRFGSKSIGVPAEIPDVLAQIPQEGMFPCGVCPVPRNGPHQVDAVFVLYPNMFFFVEPVSFLECFPWMRLNVQSIGPFTPP